MLSFLSYLPSPYFNCPLLFTVHSLYYMYEFPLICTSLLLFFLHLLFFLSYCITFPLYSTFPPLIYLHYKFSFIQIHSPLFANLLLSNFSINIIPPILFFSNMFILFWRIGWIHPFLSNHPGAIHPFIQNRPRLARQGIEQILSPKQKRRSLPFLLSLSFFYESSIADPEQVGADHFLLEHGAGFWLLTRLRVFLFDWSRSRSRCRNNGQSRSRSGK